MNSEILEEVLSCISELNGQLPPDQRLLLDAGAVVLGESGLLDSLAILNLLVAIEERMAERFDLEVSLVDAVVEADDTSTFGTVGSLVDWLAQRV